MIWLFVGSYLFVSFVKNTIIRVKLISLLMTLARCSMKCFKKLAISQQNLDVASSARLLQFKGHFSKSSAFDSLMESSMNNGQT